jgi:hypothetical protein
VYSPDHGVRAPVDRFKISTTVALDEVRRILSPKQRSALSVKPLVLTAILLSSLLVGLVVCVLILAHTLNTERAQLQRDARTVKARRLRSLQSGAEVVASRIDERRFHLL